MFVSIPELCQKQKRGGSPTLTPKTYKFYNVEKEDQSI